ncbi:hypothetical protein KIN20_033224 [Parelaphostrongylus tenuis]|uniref:Uncharacterized protein n=1 Tax=Parelaphostrongylus tenuis TaxID=148309 RepID=A0AAD5WI29_PARTN|nr:hypothetical protein KIN20_033224 [Parelaphostrongylus tenuis]
MDSFAMLNEEVFKHLCSLAIDKVSDKTEKRKAGCGGIAMRKRLLIKNFVNDLCRKKAEDEEFGTIRSGAAIESCDEMKDRSDSTVHNGHNLAPYCNTMDEDLDDGEVMVPYNDVTDVHNIWLDSAAVPDNPALSDTLTFESVDSDRSEASAPLNEKSCVSRISLYSLYSSVSESADDGDETLSACDPTESLLRSCLYNCVQPPMFDSTPLASSCVNTMSAVNCGITNSSTIQPVLAGESDQIFLSLSNNKYSDLKTYNPDFSPSPHICSVAVKRRSDEFLLYDSISSEIGYQKKIKL